MRRFFRAHRDEHYSQIQYLTAKCSRLAQEKAALERECVLSRERVRRLQADLESVCLQLHQKDNTIKELLQKLHHQQQQCVSAGDSALLSVHLESVSLELQLLQFSEKQLLSLMDELHQEARSAAEKAASLEMQLRQEAHLNAKQIDELENHLHSKAHELRELKKACEALEQEKNEQQSAHQLTVLELQCENAASVNKLRELAEQVEWLCEQQRNWLCCIRRFKDCRNDEKEALVLQVNRLQEELEELRKNPKLEMIGRADTLPRMHLSRWDVAELSNLQGETDKWREQNQGLFSNVTSSQKKQWKEDGYLKPP